MAKEKTPSDLLGSVLGETADPIDDRLISSHASEEIPTHRLVEQAVPAGGVDAQESAFTTTSAPHRHQLSVGRRYGRDTALSHEGTDDNLCFIRQVPNLGVFQAVVVRLLDRFVVVPHADHPVTHVVGGTDEMLASVLRGRIGVFHRQRF